MSIYPSRSFFSTCASTCVTTCALVASLALLAGCNDERADYDPTRVEDKTTVSSTKADKPAEKARTLKETSFELSWDLQLPKQIRNAWISPELPDVIFFQVKETFEIYAVDAYSGHTRWVTPAFDKPARVLPGASVSTSVSKGGEVKTDERIWVITDDTLFSYDATYGQLVWRFELPFSASTSPLAVGSDAAQRVFIGDWEGRMQVISYNPERNFPYVNWQMNFGYPMSGMPVHRDGLVYQGDHKGHVRCFKLDRDLVWDFDTGAPIFGSPLARGRVLYVGNDNSTIYALNRMSGERLGALYMHGAIKRGMFSFAGEPNRIYAWVEEGGGKPAGLYAIKTQSDTIPFTDAAKHALEVERMGVEWFVPGFDRLVGSTPEHLFLTKGTSTIISALHRASGKVMWSWDTNELHKQYRDDKGKVQPREAVFIAQYHDIRDANRSLFTADATGHVIAFRVFGDKPGDPLTGARVVKKAADKPAEKPAKPAENPAEAPAEAK
jgi:outer membrane protein assembly factor BamB